MATQPPNRRPDRLPPSTAALVALLLAIPLVALALVPVYSRESPHLWGWPFFYWYQVLVLVVTAPLSFVAYLLIKRARGQK